MLHRVTLTPTEPSLVPRPLPVFQHSWENQEAGNGLGTRLHTTHLNLLSQHFIWIHWVRGWKLKNLPLKCPGGTPTKLIILLVDLLNKLLFMNTYRKIHNRNICSLKLLASLQNANLLWQGFVKANSTSALISVSVHDLGTSAEAESYVEPLAVWSAW